MKIALRMLPAALTAALLFVAPSYARNYDCSKAGNANKAVCKNAATPTLPAPTVAPVSKGAPATSATRHYDCSKAGNANKVVCKGAAPTPPPATTPTPSPASSSHASAPTAPAATRTPVSRSSSPTTTNPAGPNGATAMCTDGTYSHSAHRSGTCSRHGGVKSWY